MRARFTHESGKPVTQAWIVRQAFPAATVIDQAHRAFGLWTLPEGTAANGSVRATVEPPFLGKPGQVEVIQWAPFERDAVAVR